MQTNGASHTPRSLRALLDISQVELADRAGVSVRTIGNLEDGLDVSLDTLRSVSRVLGVTFDELVAAMDFERARRAGSPA